MTSLPKELYNPDFYPTKRDGALGHVLHGDKLPNGSHGEFFDWLVPKTIRFGPKYFGAVPEETMEEARAGTLNVGIDSLIKAEERQSEKTVTLPTIIKAIAVGPGGSELVVSLYLLSAGTTSQQVVPIMIAEYALRYADVADPFRMVAQELVSIVETARAEGRQYIYEPYSALLSTQAMDWWYQYRLKSTPRGEEDYISLYNDAVFNDQWLHTAVIDYVHARGCALAEMGYAAKDGKYPFNPDELGFQIQECLDYIVSMTAACASYPVSALEGVTHGVISDIVSKRLASYKDGIRGADWIQEVLDGDPVKFAGGNASSPAYAHLVLTHLIWDLGMTLANVEDLVNLGDDVAAQRAFLEGLRDELGAHSRSYDTITPSAGKFTEREKRGVAILQDREKMERLSTSVFFDENVRNSLSALCMMTRWVHDYITGNAYLCQELALKNLK